MSETAEEQIDFDAPAVFLPILSDMSGFLLVVALAFLSLPYPV